MPMNNVDDLLNKTAIPAPVAAPEPAEVKEIIEELPEKQEKIEEESEEPEKLSYVEQFKKDKEEILGAQDAENLKKDDLSDGKEEAKEPKSHETDEYGNEVAKKRLYTEEELNAKIRERLSRGKYAEQQPMQQQVQQAAENFKSDPESSESWEQQLESFVEQTVNKLNHKQQTEQWQKEEQRIQAEFEGRFTSGMQRYKDFTDVVANKPITNGMMMATRSMSDPAAFIYAASKQQPKELERIAQINDPYQQAAEMGRLEERMRKAKKVSSTPKPSQKITSDVSGKDNEKVNIDHLIQLDAKRKLSRR